MKTDLILKDVLAKVNPSKEDIQEIDTVVKEFIFVLDKKLEKMKIKADAFVGGSFAKNTLIKKGKYDIDIFLRFDEEYKGKDISEITAKAIKDFKLGKISRIHGSRDYFKINFEKQNFFIEVVPVIKVINPKKAGNITDLSYFHVNYIKKKIKNQKILDDIKLAKAFCHANNSYGAESYIRGLSGYAIELLVYHYKGFLPFVKAIAKMKEKTIIDIEKQYKNNYEISINMNSAKMTSPIILIDPTYKERNVLAALSKETFEKLKKACAKFIKNPSINDFELKNIDFEKAKKNALKNKAEFILLDIETEKQEGDIAGSKLAKFYKQLKEEIEKLYKIVNSGFEYNGEKKAKVFFAVKSKGEIIKTGPEIKKEEHVKRFKNKHKNTFVKGNRIYARIKITQKIEYFLKDWKNENSEKIREMSIKRIDII